MGETGYRKESAGYPALANAIIELAAKDYMKALKSLKQNPGCISAERMKKDCERFFRSDWYRELTEVDGEWLIEALGKEMEVYDS